MDAYCFLKGNYVRGEIFISRSIIILHILYLQVSMRAPNMCLKILSYPQEKGKYENEALNSC